MKSLNVIVTVLMLLAPTTQLLSTHRLLTSIANCATYTGSFCFRCNSLFYPNAAEATACLPISESNCASSLGRVNGCNVCSTGFYLSSTGCLPQNPICSSLTPNTNNCLACYPPYILVKSSCQIDRSILCADYRATVNICAKCQSGYIFLNGGCFPSSDTNCSYQPVWETPCTVCKSGMYPEPSTMKCALQNVANCGTHNVNANTCSVCSANYYVDNGACALQNVANCITYVVNFNRCSTCASLFFPDGSDLCQPISKTNCLASDGVTDTCNTCFVNFYLNEGSCIAQSIPNCVLYVLNTNNCQICSPGFTASNGNCITSSGSTCNSYLSGDTATGGNCIVTFRTNCVSPINGARACAVCVTGFYADSKICVSQNVANCATYNPNTNTCASCQPTFTLNTGTNSCNQ